MSVSSRVVYECWGFKAGKLNKGFKKRLFKIHEDGVITYWSSMADILPKGKIQLDHYARVVDYPVENMTQQEKVVVQQTSWPKGYQEQSRLLVTSILKRIYCLQFESIGNKKDFLRTLVDVMRGLQPLENDTSKKVFGFIPNPFQLDLSLSQLSQSKKYMLSTTTAATASNSVSMATSNSPEEMEFVVDDIEVSSNIQDSHEYVNELKSGECSAREKGEFYHRKYHKVIIVGGGLAGLAAARMLKDKYGVADVLLLEASSNIGGRIQSTTLPSLPNIYVDAGANTVYGWQGNPVRMLVEKSECNTWSVGSNSQQIENTAAFNGQKQLSQHELSAIDTLFLQAKESMEDDIEEAMCAYIDEGGKLPTDHVLARKLKRALRRMMAENDIKEDNDGNIGQTLGYLRARTELRRGVSFNDIGSNFFLEHEDIPGDEVVVRDLAKIVLHLSTNLFYRLNQEVVSIEEVDTVFCTKEEGEKTAKIAVKNVQNNVYLCDFVLVAVPISVLKRRRIHFKPFLPESKLIAIDKIGVGHRGTIYMHFKKPFWELEAHTRGKTYFANVEDFPDPRKGNASLDNVPLHYVNLIPMFGLPILAAVVCGAHCRSLERLPDDHLISVIVSDLKYMFHSTPNECFEVLSHKVTRWSRRPFIHGSVSYLPKGETPHIFKDLASPVISSTGNPRLFFAGECTSEHHYGTLDGAMESSARAVEEMIASMLHSTINHSPVEEQSVSSKSTATATSIATAQTATSTATPSEDNETMDDSASVLSRKPTIHMGGLHKSEAKV
eukprot:m.36157 g.36157  ORF g.36157 m.36157 type:complete len:780 (-) comp6649_c0_seq2:154-2493(-)